MTPVIPPMTKVEINPIANSMELLRVILPPHMVASQPKILIPVGTAMTMVAIMKNIRNQAGVPLVNI